MKFLPLILQLLPLVALAETPDAAETEQGEVNLRQVPSLNRKLPDLSNYNGSGKGKGQAVVVDDDCYGWQQGFDMGKGKGYAVCDDPTQEPTFEPTTGKGLKLDDVDDPAVLRWVGPSRRGYGKGKGWQG